ncbi:rhomboid family intramembrane serine protease [Hyphobacterium sp. CCMP332]|nr:rhomboid family intramembrane serine protease [Hyphobacterium sp. CCMP332]
MVTYILIGIIGIVSYVAFQNREFLSKLVFNPYLVTERNEYYRFLTSGFVHGGWTHLIFNLLTFLFFGRNVEFVYVSKFGLVVGSIIFVLLFLAGVIISEIPTFLKHKNFPGYNSLGASGGVSSILFISILYFPLESICLYGILCLPGFILGILYLIYSAYADKQAADNINHSAHFTGAAFGIIIAVLIEPKTLLSFVNQIMEFRIF